MPTNAIDLLVEQHRRMEASFKKVMDASPEQRKPLFDQAADLLMSHISIEEQLFYPATKDVWTEDILLESLEEHLSLKRVLADLVAMTPDDQRYEPKLHVLKEQAEHHHKEEEEHLFPKVKELLDEARLEALGQQMAQLQARLLRDRARCLVVDQTEQAASLR